MVPKGDYYVSSEFLVLRENQQGDRKYLLLPYLFTDTIQTILYWSQRGTNHPRFSEKLLMGLGFPDIKDDELVYLKDNIIQANQFFEQSKAIYTDAERMVLEGINFSPDILEHDLSFIGDCKTVVNATRIDADFYQPKYNRLLKLVKSKNSCLISDIETFSQRGIQPEYYASGDVEVITSKRLGNEFVDLFKSEKTLFSEWEKHKRAQIRYLDVLIYTTGAYVGRTNCWLADIKAFASNHVNILRVKDVDPIYLSVYLNSILGQMQVRKFVSGSAQVELYPSDIRNFILWVPDRAFQNKIAEKINESYKLRMQALELLRKAVQEVTNLIG